MSEMVERVTGAIADAMADAQIRAVGPISRIQTWQLGVSRNLARAAIAAMRPPTDEMIGWGKGHLTLLPEPHGRQDWYDEEVRDVWQAMIDAALGEP